MGVKTAGIKSEKGGGEERSYQAGGSGVTPAAVGRRFRVSVGVAFFT